MPQAISDTDLNALIARDPQIQQIVQGVWGQTPVNQRPGDTPKNLEAANDQASKQIASVLQSRGIQLPKHTFINPRSATVEHMHGWAGLPTAAKVAIIAGAAATGIGAAGALGALGGGAAAGAGGAGAGSAAGTAGAAIPTIGATGGLAAGAFPTIAGTAGAGMAGGGAVGGGGILSALSKVALSKGAKNPQSYLDLAQNAGSVLGKQQEGRAAGALAQAGAQQSQDRNAISLYAAQQAAENAGAQTDLQRQEFGAKEQGRNAKNAILSALLGGNLPRNQVSVSGIPHANVSGGMLEALKSNPEALASLSMLKDQAGKSLASGPSFTGGSMVTPPSLTALPDTGGGNSFLSTLATIGQLAGAASPALKKKPLTPAPSEEGYG